MDTNKTQPISWTEHVGVIMTPDKKCIIRGRERNNTKVIFNR